MVICFECILNLGDNICINGGVKGKVVGNFIFSIMGIFFCVFCNFLSFWKLLYKLMFFFKRYGCSVICYSERLLFLLGSVMVVFESIGVGLFFLIMEVMGGDLLIDFIKVLNFCIIVWEFKFEEVGVFVSGFIVCFICFGGCWCFLVGVFFFKECVVIIVEFVGNIWGLGVLFWLVDRNMVLWVDIWVCCCKFCVFFCDFWSCW